MKFVNRGESTTGNHFKQLINVGVQLRCVDVPLLSKNRNLCVQRLETQPKLINTFGGVQVFML